MRRCGKDNTYERRYTYKILVGRYGGRRPLPKSGSLFEDNIKVDLGEI
jgi:hypothetical protein